MPKRNERGWRRNEMMDLGKRIEFVDIYPRGEEGKHIANAECACEPRLSKDIRGRDMIIHNSWDGREGFEAAEAALPENYKGRMAA